MSFDPVESDPNSGAGHKLKEDASKTSHLHEEANGESLDKKHIIGKKHGRKHDQLASKGE